MIATEYDELDRELGELADDRPGRRSSGLRILPIAVGVVSLLALGAIVWYAYSQGVREGSETAAPLLRPDSPMKERPADPGGREIAGTELGIYDRISGDDGTTASVERILPPPEEPRFPSLQSAQTPTTSGESVPQVPAPNVTASSARTSDASGASAQSGQIPASRPPVPAPDPVLAAPTSPPPTAGSDTQQTAAAPVQPVAEPPSVPTSAPSSIAAAPATPAGSAGTGWRIQIAALKSDGEARAEWSRRQSANSDLLGNLALQIQQATVNGTTYYRVRGGPIANADAAKALCERLKAKSVACIPVAPGK